QNAIKGGLLSIKQIPDQGAFTSLISNLLEHFSGPIADRLSTLITGTAATTTTTVSATTSTTRPPGTCGSSFDCTFCCASSCYGEGATDCVGGICDITDPACPGATTPAEWCACHFASVCPGGTGGHWGHCP